MRANAAYPSEFRENSGNLLFFLAFFAVLASLKPGLPAWGEFYLVIRVAIASRRPPRRRRTRDEVQMGEISAQGGIVRR